MYDAKIIEERGKPTVTLCSSGFVTDARAAASSKGMPVLRLISENLASAPGRAPMADVEAAVDATMMNDVIDSLTKPLTAEEISPKPKPAEKFPRIIFKGSLEEINRFFYRRGWTDGLPIIPPTEEAVVEMLTGTDLPPDYVIGKMLPRLGKATVEKVAINAVMAGALPTYMPVLIAGVRASLDPKAHGQGWAVSAGSWAPFWIINGPVRNDLHINSGIGMLSPGDIANAAIGRAMGLIIKNIRGTRKGVEDMGIMGNPMKYSMVAAEAEEDSPWEPLHVEQGFKKDDSAISLFFPNTLIGTAGKFPDIIYRVPQGAGVTCFIITPTHAKELAEQGWTKKSIKNYLSENTRVPFYQSHYYPIGSNVVEGYAKDQLPPNPQDTVKVMANPEGIWIFVAGGPTSGMGIMRGSPRFKLGGDLAGYRINLVTHKIELPKNWDKLVKKYQDVVPTYVNY